MVGISGAGIAGGSAGGSIAYKSYNYQSATGSSGTEYIGGFYALDAADKNLTQAATTGTTGAVLVPYGAHALLVAGGAGAATGGTTGTADITVSGTSIDSAGTRTAADTEVIVPDVTAMAANQYFETVKKWIGQVTYTIATTGDRTTFNADFNTGLAKYEDFGNTDFRVVEFEVVGIGGTLADAGFDVTICSHSASNWTYHATAFTYPSNAIASMGTDYSTESDLDADVPFSYKRAGLTTQINGSQAVPTTSTPNGIMIQIVTSANGAIRTMDCHVGVSFT